LKNVFPELFDPLDKAVVVYHGEVRNVNLNACFDTLGARSGGSKIGVYPCHGQVFIFTLFVCLLEADIYKKFAISERHTRFSVRDTL
jgi:hypothetical protein